MKDWWKVLARMSLPMIRMSGEQFKAKDDNSTGQDDMIGIGLVFAADFIEAAINGTPLPKTPSILK